jgi:isoquinoline 1-oxidoreductase beta subunit
VSARTDQTTINRRRFVQLAAAASAGLVLGIPWPARAQDTANRVWLNPLIRIDTDGVVTLFAQNPEMGQGVKTALPMILAEELEVDWEAIRVEQADWIPGLDLQFSGGSLSVRLNAGPMRQVGAAAREMLIAAAAHRWHRDAAQLHARHGRVVDSVSGDSLSYGELAEAAASETVPDAPTLKDSADFRLIGRSIPDVDLDAIVSGQQRYSMDLKLPDMLYAVVRRCPVGDGQPASFDDGQARQVPGVVDVRLLKNSDHGGRIILPNCPNFVSGVAVLATSTWAALQAASKLQVEWDLPASLDDSALLSKRFEAALDGEDGELVRNDGNVDKAARNATQSIDVLYRLPFLAHVPMEPMNCTARVADGKAEIWAPTQNPGMAAEAVAKALGIRSSEITIHVMRSGGAFGRRYYADFVVDTAILARDSGRPVKVVWPREDDVRHDYFRSASVQRVHAGLDGDDRIAFWHQKVASHPRGPYLEREGSPSEIGDNEFPAAFVPNLRYEYTAVPARVPLGQWRAVSNSSNVFVMAGVVDELAHAAGQDPLQFWLSLIGSEQTVQVLPNFRFDASRLRAVVEKVAGLADWGRALPKGRGRGLAACYDQGAWVAEVAEVTVDGESLRVDRICAALDCGLLINPRGATAQAEGAILDGMSAALFGEITVREGVVEQSNFDDYRLCRIGQAPALEIEFVANEELPRGIGEGPLPPVAPAICNAIFAATGQRIRELPIGRNFRI